MAYVIAYDISDDRERERIAEILGGFGHRVQYSVFEVNVDAKGLVDVVAEIEPHVSGTIDSVRIYRQCANCAANVHVIGRGARADADPRGGAAWIV